MSETRRPTVGVLMLEGEMARLPGCLGTPESFPYPAIHRVVEGARPPAGPDDVERLLPLYAAAARELEREGAGVITENCNGAMVRLQDRLAAAVAVPVVTSSLLLAPTVAALMPGRRLGILTFFAHDLGEWHYRACGWSSEEIPVAVAGVGECPGWLEFLRSKRASTELRDQMAEELVAAGRKLLEAHDDLGAFLLECTLLPPVAEAVRRGLGLPVFDVLNLIDLAAAGYFRPAAARAAADTARQPQELTTCSR